MEKKRNIKLPPRSLREIIRLIRRYKRLRQEELRVRRSFDRKLGTARRNSRKKKINPEKNVVYKLYCPKCGQEKLPDIAILARKYSGQAPALPYFLCSGCLTICLDKGLIMECVSAWRKDSPHAKKLPFKKFYEEAIRYLEEEVISYYTSRGYKRITYKRVLN